MIYNTHCEMEFQTVVIVIVIPICIPTHLIKYKPYKTRTVDMLLLTITHIICKRIGTGFLCFH